MSESAARPNILVLFSDQLRPFELGCYGHPIIRTPHLDRLAAMGVRFEHAVTSNPVCTPARASLISGQYGRTCIGMLGCCGEPVSRRVGFPDTTLPEVLQAQGYETSLTGKWHIQPRPERVGFETACYPLVNHANRVQVYFDEQRRGEQVSSFCPDYEVETSRRFIARDHDRPWFLFHNFSLPHMPHFDVPDAWRQLYVDAGLPLRPNVSVDGQVYHDETAFKIYLFDHLCTKRGLTDHFKLPDGYDIHSLYADYSAMVTCVDDQVGRLLDALEASGQLDSTIIVFSADHGDNLGSHHLWNKISVNDEAIRVPLLVAQPGRLTPAVVDDQVASLVDVAPTLLGLAGLDVPATMQGADLSGLLAGTGGTARDGAAFCENLRGELAIRTPTHLYAVMTRTGADSPEREWIDDAFMFSDLRTDPYQLTNLVDTGDQAELAAELRERLRAWDAATPWLPGSRGGVYGQGPVHDPAVPPPRNYRR